MNIKIFTSYHKPCELVKTNIIEPIQVGTAINGTVYKNHLHDDTGDNISAKNRMYCEMTAQYWAWKNTDLDYYGFMHYRRYFSFNSSVLDEDQFGNVIMPNISCKEYSNLKIDDSVIQRLVAANDLITVTPQDVRNLGTDKNVYEHYKNSPHHLIRDLDIVGDIISEKYPEFVKPMRKYLRGSTAYFCNMYIMKKELFQQYCEWLFTILEEHEKRSDFSLYDINQLRVSGFLAERLWGIYYTWLIENKPDLKTLALQKTFFTAIEQSSITAGPAFEKNNIPIIMAVNDSYIPYTAVTIQSIIECGSPKNNYDIVIFHSDITNANQEKLICEFKPHTNLSIRFRNVNLLFQSINVPSCFHITQEGCYRLLAKDVMVGYDKVVYIDSDLVLLDDIANLYYTPVEHQLLAAVVDIDMAGMLSVSEPIRTALMKRLRLPNKYDYFNSGVLVMNLDEIRKQYSTDDILNFISSDGYVFIDQDILNHMCKGNYVKLDSTWNVMMNWQDHTGSRLQNCINAPAEMYLDYMKSRKNPKIVHYAGFQKPWDLPNCDFAKWFWLYARKTSYYEFLLSKNISLATSTPVQNLATAEDSYQIRINGVNETIYIDGLYIKLINKLNKLFPKGSKKRNFIKKLARIFVK